MSTNYAFVTLLTSDAYLPGALALVAALNDLHLSQDPPFQTVCLVTPETVDVSSIKLLRKAFNVVVGVEVIQQQDSKALQLLGRPDLYHVLTKLHIFRLTQYSKLIFLDADVLPVRPISHLFTLPHEFSAVPDVGWPDIFNSGVLVFSPGEDKFNELMALLKSRGSWDGGDQGILNEWRGDNWHRLSFIYNTTPTAIYTYAPAYERFGSQISAIHFIGPNKPWNALSYRSAFTKTSVAESPEQAYDYNSLLDRWFDVYDNHYRSRPITADASFEVKKSFSTWEQQSTSHPTAPPPPEPPSGSILSLEELRRAAIEGLHSVTSLTGNRQGDGDYFTLPLEGRVDLMRPKTPQELAVAEDVAVDANTQQETGRQHSTGPQVTRPEGPSLGSLAGLQDTTSGYMGMGDAYLGSPSLENTGLVYTNYGAVSPRTNDFGTVSHNLGSTGFGSGTHVENAALKNTNNVDGALWTNTSATDPTSGHARLESHSDPSSLYSTGRPVAVSSGSAPSLPRTSYMESNVGGSSAVGTTSSSGASLESRISGGTMPGSTGTSVDDAVFFDLHAQADLPSTPVSKPRTFGLPVVLEPLPTPGPHEVPPSPRPGIISLPPTPSPVTWAAKPPSTPPKFPQFVPEQKPADHEPPSEELRPRSPPLLLWNPAIEPPPTTAPSSSFPTDTYYPNAWDHSPTNVPSHPQEHAQLFYPPPTPDIPKPLVQQGHYREVTGEGISGGAPIPDPKKIKNIFPWENQPRSSPGRIFPSAEIQSPTPAKSTAGNAASPGPLSPLRGLPVNLAYANTWDTIPAIQKYATRLRPPKFAPPLAPPFDDSEWKKNRSRGDRTEVSSRDGDDEDSEDDSPADDSDKDKPKSGRSSRRSSIVSATELITGKKKQYRTRGVQTVPREMRSRSVQVNTFLIDPLGSSKSKARPFSPGLGDVSLQPDLPMSTALPTPVIESRPLPFPLRSNSEQTLSTHFSVQIPMSTQTTMRVPTLKTPTLVSRQVSNDSSLGSPVSSGPPASPSDVLLNQSPIRKGGRVWDPARGVELFKRGSEEVLARFLKMGTWEDEASRYPR